MGVMDSMMFGGAVASGGVELDLGTALWLFLVINLVASGLGIIAKAHRGRPLDPEFGRRPKAPGFEARPSRLCEVGSF